MDFNAQKSELSFSIEKILQDDFSSCNRPAQTSVMSWQRPESYLEPWTSNPAVVGCYPVAFSPYVIMKYLPPHTRAAATKFPRQLEIKEEFDFPMNKTEKINERIDSYGYETSQKDNDDTSCGKHLQESKTAKCLSEKGHKKKRRNRSHFTQRQLQYLEKIFSSQQYLTRDERTLLARGLEMTELQIRNWFQNRRYQRRHRNSEDARNKTTLHGTAVEA